MNHGRVASAKQMARPRRLAAGVAAFKNASSPSSVKKPLELRNPLGAAANGWS